jgi:outer membrane usher protein
VFHEGNLIGRTDSSGHIVLPRLTPYTANRITIEERDLPINVAIKDREMRVVPQFRSGTLAEYDAQKRVSVILEVRLADGSYLPAGSQVQQGGSGQRYTVGQDGEVFIPDLPVSTHFTAQPASGLCIFDVDVNAVPKELLPKLSVVCRQRPG